MTFGLTRQETIEEEEQKRRKKREEISLWSKIEDHKNKEINILPGGTAKGKPKT